MDVVTLRRERLRAHRVTAPASDIVATAQHMTATQAQEFWGGRWALAARTAGEPSLDDVDAAFDRGDLVRTWTQRGTLHILPAADVRWMLRVTADRQARQGAAMRRSLGIDEVLTDRAERLVRAALRGGNRLTRREFGDLLETDGIRTEGSRGNHLFSALALRGIVVLGPLVPRAGAPTREQFIVATDDWIPAPAAPEDPLAEILVRYLRGHGPATLADAGWWAGLPIGLIREARERAGDRVVAVDEQTDGEELLLAAEHGSLPDAADAGPAVIALPGWDEYYLSYRDRTVSCEPGLAARVGPSQNGLVRPILLADGVVVGTWTHSLAAGRHHHPPEVRESTHTDPAEVAAALARVHRFLGSHEPTR